MADNTASDKATAWKDIAVLVAPVTAVVFKVGVLVVAHRGLDVLQTNGGTLSMSRKGTKISVLAPREQPLGAPSLPAK